MKKTLAKSRISEFVVGLVFGLGLIVSGMTDPGKVLGFLDLAGPWDPSLAFVMGGAILVTLIAFRGSRSAKPLCAPAFQEPATTRIDRRLLAGSALFGIGWGLAGICPGPALVLAGMLRAEMLWFGGAILAGMWLFRLQKRP